MTQPDDQSNKINDTHMHADSGGFKNTITKPKTLDELLVRRGSQKVQERGGRERRKRSTKVSREF